MSIRYPAGFIRIGYDPLKVPDAPTGATATGGDASADVSFTAPSNTGGSAITQYTAVSTPGQLFAQGSASPLTVTGLTNGTSYTFAVWALNTFGPSPYSTATGSVTPVASIGLFGGGTVSGSYTNVIQSINISTIGNAIDFGDLTVARRELAACASSTRGLFAGGASLNIIDYVTITSSGNAIDFGDMLAEYTSSGGCNSATRGVFSGGNSSGIKNVIQYVTIASAGNAIDFGDLTVAREGPASCSSSTRGVTGGGYNGTAYINVIDYITIASVGNATDFGDLTAGSSGQRAGLASCSSSTRGLFAGGYNQAATYTNIIDYITIATTGNATDFGDLLVNISGLAGCSSSTRGVFGGGDNLAGNINVLQYVTIASTGNAIDFGDLLGANFAPAACSNVNGGVQ